MIKRIISFLLVLCFSFSISLVFAQNTTNTIVYSPDGTSKIVSSDDVDTYLSDNWFLWPVVTIYGINNTSSVVYASDADYHLKNGWYISPVTTIYAPNGATSIVYTYDVDVHLANGWYLSPDDFPQKAKAVALTFDDGPSKHTTTILNCLERYGAKATFFVVGNSVLAYPDTLKRAYDMGMEIGNHTMKHSRLTTLSASGISSQINSCATVVKNVTGATPKLVRPPYGSYNQSTISAAGHPFILWSIDTLDWKTRDAQKTVDAVLSEVSDGDIILMHDLYLPTAQATEILVPKLIEMGFDLVTVSELAERKGLSLGAKAYRKLK